MLGSLFPGGAAPAPSGGRPPRALRLAPAGQPSGATGDTAEVVVVALGLHVAACARKGLPARRVVACERHLAPGRPALPTQTRLATRMRTDADVAVPAFRALVNLQTALRKGSPPVDSPVRVRRAAPMSPAGRLPSCRVTAAHHNPRLSPVEKRRELPAEVALRSMVRVVEQRAHRRGGDAKLLSGRLAAEAQSHPPLSDRRADKGKLPSRMRSLHAGAYRLLAPGGRSVGTSVK